MGVPGLWRLLDMASEPCNLEFDSGLRLAVDINSYLNRLLHSQNASDWLFYLMRDLFCVLHFDVKMVIVFMGKKPIQKVYSADLSDGSSGHSYHRVRSALMRASLERSSHHPEEPKPPESPDTFNLFERAPQPRPSRVPPASSQSGDPFQFSIEQLTRFSKYDPPTRPDIVHHPSASVPFIFSTDVCDSHIPKGDPVKLESVAPTVQVEAFRSEFLDDVSDLLQGEDPSSEGAPLPIPDPTVLDLMPISLLPADQPYLPPTENYVTVDHVRMATELFKQIGIPFIFAPEEAVAECARLESAGIVDATASDDNNAILFGSKWMIRGIFSKPQSITMRSLERIGITAKRLLMLAMMIDGDYNADIRRRLFTVGPVRGLEIIAHFPDEDLGLLQFKEWWIRVVKDGGEESNPHRRILAKRKWLKRLLMPIDFPPEELVSALTNPVVGTEIPKLTRPRFNEEEVVNFVSGTTCIRQERIREYCRAFAKRTEGFTTNRIELTKYKLNPVREVEAFATHFEMIARFDRVRKGEEELQEEIALPRTEEEEDSVGSDSVVEDL
jgi:5'-3' exonuclease